MGRCHPDLEEEEKISNNSSKLEVKLNHKLNLSLKLNKQEETEEAEKEDEENLEEEEVLADNAWMALNIIVITIIFLF
jgi:hypothetical protein